MSQIKSDQRVRLNRLYSYLVEHLSTLYITSTLKSLQVIPVIWLDLIGAINSQIAPFFFCSKSHIFPIHCGSFTEMQQPITFLKKPIKLQGYLYFKGILQGYLHYILYKNNKRKKKFLQLPKDQFTTGSTKHLNRLKNRVSKNKQKTFWTKHEPIRLCSSLVSGLIISHQCPKEAIVTA